MFNVVTHVIDGVVCKTKTDKYKNYEACHNVKMTYLTITGTATHANESNHNLKRRHDQSFKKSIY